MPPRRTLLRATLLVLLCSILTTVLQSWVGNHTIYAKDREARILQAHEAFRTNRLPEGVETWKDFGAAGLNQRVFVIRAAEGLHRLLGISVLRVYRGIDSICLFLTMLLLFVYLRHWFDDTLCLVGLLYFAFTTVLTYYLYLFHPWDRISLLGWLVLLFLIRGGRPVLCGVLLAVAMTIKYDVLLLPALYGLATWGRTSRRIWTLTTLGLFGVTGGMFLLLRQLFPGGFEEGSEFTKLTYWIQGNFSDLMNWKLSYPPLLAFLLPMLLALPGLARRQRFVWSCVLFALATFMLFPWVMRFQEVRAEMPLLLLLLPAALANLQQLTAGGSGPDTPGNLPASGR